MELEEELDCPRNQLDERTERLETKARQTAEQQMERIWELESKFQSFQDTNGVNTVAERSKRLIEKGLESWQKKVLEKVEGAVEASAKSVEESLGSPVKRETGGDGRGKICILGFRDSGTVFKVGGTRLRGIGDNCAANS